MASVSSNQFTLLIEDPCETATINGSINLHGATVSKGESHNVYQSFSVLTDSVSDAFGVLNNCGYIAYEVLDTNGLAAPSIVSVVYT